MSPNLLPSVVPAVAVPGLMVVVLGLVVLLFGRRLYWAFVAVAAFLVGIALADEWLADQEAWVRVLASIGAGLLGAVFELIAQRLAFAIGGFFAGGYVALAIQTHRHAGGSPDVWMIAGGVIGAIVAALIMDWAIIVLSSFAGAAAVLSPFQARLDDGVLGALLLVLVIVGIVAQARQLTGRPGPPRAAARSP